MANRRPALTTRVTLRTMLLISTLYTAAELSAATLTTIYAFTGSPDGANPAAAVFIGPGGVLYGTTPYGGNVACKQNGSLKGCGAVFSLTPPAAPGGSWTEDVYSFSPKAFGTYGGVVGKDGVLYGTTLYLGGSVFALKPPATPGGQWLAETIGGGGPAVEYPYDTLAIGAGGVLYGTSYEGGVTFDQEGDVFAVTPPASPGGSWTTTALSAISSYPETVSRSAAAE